ncbi:MAG: DUF3298 domain-containing protein [Candidatus Hydrogenedentota bacterium]
MIKLKMLLIVLLLAGFTLPASARVEFWTYGLQDSRVILPAAEDETPAAEFHMRYLYPMRGADTPLLEKLRRQCARSFFGRPVDSPSRALMEERDSWFGEYEDVCAEYDSNIGVFAYRWSMESLMSVRINEPGLIVLENAEYLFTGGAHGVYGSDFTVIDPRSADTVGLEHLFPSSSVMKLGPMIERKILQELARRLDDNVSRDDLLTEKVEPTSNFYLTKKGVVFHYNVYEVAPYAAGEFDILLPFSEIRKLMRPEAYRRWAGR